MKASIKSHTQSPRKVRLVVDLVRGKKVPDALAALSFLPKRAALPLKKLIASAAASAKQQGKDPNTLRIKSFTVDSAGMLTRYAPKAFGRAAAIRRRRSLVRLTLSE